MTCGPHLEVAQGKGARPARACEVKERRGEIDQWGRPVIEGKAGAARWRSFGPRGGVSVCGSN
jgi:hypothetical protein